MRKTWRKVEAGLYQRVDDGVPQNVYIDRIKVKAESGRWYTWGWTWIEVVDDSFMQVDAERFQTLKEAKVALMDVVDHVERHRRYMAEK